MSENHLLISVDVPSSLSKAGNEPTKNKERIWNNFQEMSKFTSLEEQYIILIFQTVLNLLANIALEIIINNIYIRNNVSNFSVKIPFEHANSKCVAYEGNIKGRHVWKENQISKMCLLNLRYNLETNQNSNVFMRKKCERATPFPTGPGQTTGGFCYYWGLARPHQLFLRYKNFLRILS